MENYFCFFLLKKKVSAVKVFFCFLFLQPIMKEEEVDKERKTPNKIIIHKYVQL